MIPTAMFLAVLFVSIMVSFIVGYAIRIRVEKWRVGRPNVFDAYSDYQLKLEHEKTSRKVRQYHGSTIYRSHFQNNLQYLQQINKEIDRRSRLKLKPISDIQQFDVVYDTVLKSINQSKEKK
jgi:hypothetical protein